jgi:tRNA threonylcarbamoyladenosine modification (KEOPS) complex  Pcc1 subunit
LTNRTGIKAFSAVITLEIDSQSEKMLRSVLTPELTQSVSPRSSVKIGSGNGKFQISVKGRDLSSFKASVTSIFRLLNVVTEMQKIVDGKPH